MFGGTAKTYATWEFIGDVFEENGRPYIYAVKPGTSTKRKVRWYNDQAHNDIMEAAGVIPAEEKKKFCTLFGFEDENDYILVIREVDLSEAEIANYFHYNWKRGNKWLRGAFFGNCWYAPKDAAIPPIKNINKIFRASWPEFKKQGQMNSLALNEGKQSCSRWWAED